VDGGGICGGASVVPTIIHADSIGGHIADFNHCLGFKMRWQTNVVKFFC
jgi:hypothetical protein